MAQFHNIKQAIKSFVGAIKATVLALLLVLTLSVMSAPGVSAACARETGDSNPNAIIQAPGELPRVGCDDTSTLETVLKLVFGAMAMMSILFIVIGGIKYTISGGDSNAIASAKNTILYAVIGLVLGLSAFTISSYVIRWFNG